MGPWKKLLHVPVEGVAPRQRRNCAVLGIPEDNVAENPAYVPLWRRYMEDTKHIPNDRWENEMADRRDKRHAQRRAQGLDSDTEEEAQGIWN